VPSLGGVKMIGKYLEGKEEYFYFAFRVLIGFLFFQHGAQKLFGLFGGKSVPLFGPPFLNSCLRSGFELHYMV
jgi:uncharacterized membrane protein YphA (DoxX/SURF4 family)